VFLFLAKFHILPNQKKKAQAPGTTAFYGEKWHNVATVGGIIFWIRHI
jgi:hypothetical protein